MSDSSLTIDDILKNYSMEKLDAMNEKELATLLAPIIPSARAAVLPEEKPRKLGLDVVHMKDAVQQNKAGMLELAETLKNIRAKKEGT